MTELGTEKSTFSSSAHNHKRRRTRVDRQDIEHALVRFGPFIKRRITLTVPTLVQAFGRVINVRSALERRRVRRVIQGRPNLPTTPTPTTQANTAQLPNQKPLTATPWHHHRTTYTSTPVLPTTTNHTASQRGEKGGSRPKVGPGPISGRQPHVADERVTTTGSKAERSLLWSGRQTSAKGVEANGSRSGGAIMRE